MKQIAIFLLTLLATAIVLSGTAMPAGAAVNGAWQTADTTAVAAPDSLTASPVDSAAVSKQPEIQPRVKRDPLDDKRTITPVNVRDRSQAERERQRLTHQLTQKKIDRSAVKEITTDDGTSYFVDTVTNVTLPDSIADMFRPKNLYPRFTAVTIGVNFWDPFMRLLGQQYGGAEVWGLLSLHNRFNPIIGVGVSSADVSPDESNFTWKSKLAPYFNIGILYNVFYNNSPDYQLLVGLRYGITHFSYEVVDITTPPGYWRDPSTFSIPQCSSTAGYIEVSLGVKVKLFSNLSAGWQFKFRTIAHESNAPYGQPLVIPGFGKRTNNFGVGLSLMYTLPLNITPRPGVKKDKK